MPTGGPKGEKRPADVIGNAVKVMRIATGEELEDFGNAPRKGSRLHMRRALCGWLFSLLILSPRSLQGSNRLGSLPTS